MGPGFFYEYLNAENTIRKPYGGGEQNMFNFAYNLYNLKYQKRTDQLDTDVLKISLSHLNSGNPDSITALYSIQGHGRF